MTKLKARLTYANVMATIAVFLALGGGAIAAIKIPKKSVGTKQLKANAVTEAKLADKAVSNAKLGDAAVNGAKVQDRSIGLSKTAVIDTTVTQNFGSIGANSCQAIDKSIPGNTQQFDQVEVIADPTVGSGDNTWYGGALTAFAGPSDAPPSPEIQLHACNGTGVAADPPNTTFRVLVFR